MSAAVNTVKRLGADLRFDNTYHDAAVFGDREGATRMAPVSQDAEQNHLAVLPAEGADCLALATEKNLRRGESPSLLRSFGYRV